MRHTARAQCMIAPISNPDDLGSYAGRVCWLWTSVTLRTRAFCMCDASATRCRNHRRGQIARTPSVERLYEGARPAVENFNAPWSTPTPIQPSDYVSCRRRQRSPPSSGQFTDRWAALPSPASQRRPAGGSRAPRFRFRHVCSRKFAALLDLPNPWFLVRRATRARARHCFVDSWRCAKLSLRSRDGGAMGYGKQWVGARTFLPKRAN